MIGFVSRCIGVLIDKHSKCLNMDPIMKRLISSSLKARDLMLSTNSIFQPWGTNENITTTKHYFDNTGCITTFFCVTWWSVDILGGPRGEIGSGVGDDECGFSSSLSPPSSSLLETEISRWVTVTSKMFHNYK